MLGALAGDVIGSTYEAGGYKDYDFALFTEYSRFTDDSVMTIAVAEALMGEEPFERAMRRWGRRYPLCGYGRTFEQWLLDDAMGPYGSWGNGAAMRVSPIGWWYDDLATVLREARASAAVSHDHPEGVKGAQAAAACVWLARNGSAKDAIRAEIESRFGYDLQRTVDAIRPDYTFDSSGAGSVPESIVCFLDGTDFESTIRNAVSLGGDTDTMACIAGAIAEAFHGAVPADLAGPVRERLPGEMLAVLDAFREARGMP